MRAVRYALWAATLVIVTWAICLISALVGSKGMPVRQPIRATED